jgi:uncharacterized membrane protein YfcA
VIDVGLGLLVGLVIGALGGGGGIITVPVLVYLVSMEPVAATTASLVIVGVASLASMVSHTRGGGVRWGAGAAFGLVGVAGTWAGSWAAARVRGDHLLLAFGLLLLTVAVAMLRKGSPAEPTATRPPSLRDRSSLVRIVGVALGVGLLTGFFGVGGGFVVVPALVLLLRMPMSSAVATSLLVVSINSASALVARLGQGVHLEWPVVWLFTAGAVAGGLVGVALHRRVPDQALTRAFAILLVVVAAWTLVRSGIALAG